MKYRIYQPDQALSAFVDYYYHSEGTFSEEEHTILPDGKVDLVFVLSAGVKMVGRNDAEPVTPGGVLQSRKKKIFSVIYDGQLELFGIRFSPRGCLALLGFPMAELPEHPVSLADIFKAEANSLEESLFEVKDSLKKIDIIERWLVRQRIKNDLTHQWEWDWIDKLMSTSGTMPLQTLIKESDANYKRIQRFFRNQLGISPKYFARILRLEAMHKELREREDQPVDWMSVVVKYGFYDQSHLIHEFEYMTGHSPEQFVTNLPQFI